MPTASAGVVGLGEGDDRVRAGVVGDHLDAQRVVGLGVAVRGQGYGDDRGVEVAGGGQGGPDQADGGERRGARADQGEQDDRSGVAQLRRSGPR